MAPTVGELVARASHAGPLDGADLVGEAAGAGRLLVRLGLWLDAGGSVARARFRATSCASLIAFAEAACALAESGAVDLGPARLRDAVRGMHPRHRDRADLVALAFARANRGGARRSGQPTAARYDGGSP